MKLSSAIALLSFVFTGAASAAAPAAASTDDARLIAPVYLVWQGQMMLDAPVQDAWRHVIDYPSWQRYPVVKHVSGEPGREGQVVLLKKGEEGFEFPAYYARTIKLDPGRSVIWKIYPETTQEVDFFGIVEFTTDAADGKTRFGYSLIYEFLVPYRHQSELDAFRKTQYENFATLFSTILPNLKKRVEEGPEP